MLPDVLLLCALSPPTVHACICLVTRVPAARPSPPPASAHASHNCGLIDLCLQVSVDAL